jgi:hypothetical protein
MWSTRLRCTHFHRPSDAGGTGFWAWRADGYFPEGTLPILAHKGRRHAFSKKNFPDEHFAAKDRVGGKRSFSARGGNNQNFADRNKWVVLICATHD